MEGGGVQDFSGRVGKSEKMKERASAASQLYLAAFKAATDAKRAADEADATLGDKQQLIEHHV